MKLMSHEKLTVYQKSIRFLVISSNITKEMPRGNSSLSDQLKRASLSIILNIAEASGKTTKLDNKKFFAIARGSALECAAVMDACRILKLSNTKNSDDGKKLLFEIVSMLTCLCR